MEGGEFFFDSFWVNKTPIYVSCHIVISKISFCKVYTVIISSLNILNLPPKMYGFR